jgi:hypothetical protein
MMATDTMWVPPDDVYISNGRSDVGPRQQGLPVQQLTKELELLSGQQLIAKAEALASAVVLTAPRGL